MSYKIAIGAIGSVLAGESIFTKTSQASQPQVLPNNVSEVFLQGWESPELAAHF